MLEGLGGAIVVGNGRGPAEVIRGRHREAFQHKIAGKVLFGHRHDGSRFVGGCDGLSRPHSALCGRGGKVSTSLAVSERGFDALLVHLTNDASIACAALDRCF